MSRAIPLVDLNTFISGTDAEKKSFVEDLGHAFQEFGFVGVINHGALIALDTPHALGGRGNALAKISYRNADGQVVEIESDTPTQVVRDLATTVSGELAELKITRPSLEDVYLAMIGREDE